MPSACTPGSLLCAVGFDSSAPAANVTALWSQVDQYTGSGNIKGTSVVKYNTSSSTSQQPFSSATTAAVIIVAEFKCDTGFSSSGSGAVDVHSVNHSSNATPPAITSTSVTPTISGDAAFVVCIDDTSSDTAPASLSGMTTIATVPVTSGANIPGNGIACYQLTIGTSAYSKTATWSGSTASGAEIFVICFAGFASACHGSLIATTGAATLTADGVSDTGSLSSTTGAATLVALGTSETRHGSLVATTGTATLSAAGSHLTGQMAQVGIECIQILPPAPVQSAQVILEAVRSYQTVPIQAAQVCVEAIVPRVVLPNAGNIAPAGSYAVGGTPTPNPGAKYRIYIYDTSDNLVAIFTQCRAFDFIDSVNGGSAAGWFRISVDTTTLLSEDTAGATRSDQYRKNYMGSLNSVTIGIAPVTGGPTGINYEVTFSGNCGQQIVTFTIDDYYQISIPIYGNANTPDTFTELVAQALINYFSQLGTQYSVQYTSGESTLTVVGASPNQYTPTGGSATYIGVQVQSSYMLPNNLSAAYQQAFQYNYRVQFYIEDYSAPGGIGDPWYDGRINGWTPQIPDTSTDDSYITVYTEGYQNALNDGIVTETLNPGVQPNGVNNGTITADQYLRHLLLTYQNSAKFLPPFISAVPVDLYQLQFQGEGLASCINDVITQVISDTGHTYEWWVRGLKNVGQGRSLGVVVQPNADPKLSNPYMRIAPTANPIQRYFMYEVRGQTVYDYQVQNTIINLYNMIALYGGRDPFSQLQVYGAYEDSISISLYGLRQQRVTNDNLLSTNTLNNYAIAYLLLNAYPQPQTQYYKYKPDNRMRAGVWVQVLEPGDGTVIAQTLHQMRSIQVECQLQEDQEKMDQIVTAAAPMPFIDHAYYGAIQQSKNTIPIIIQRGGTINPNTYMVGGGDWVTAERSNFPPVPIISPPLGHFGKAKQGPNGQPPTLPLDISLTQSPSDPHYPNFAVPLVDTNSGRHGDGAYELDFVTNMQEFAPEQPEGAGILVTAVGGPKSIGGNLTSGNVQETPASPDSLRLWSFVVLDGAIAGATDLRTYYGQYAGAPDEAATIILTVPPGPGPNGKQSNVHILYQAEQQNQKDWYGGFQMGTSGHSGGIVTEVLLWFAQTGAPYTNLNLPGNTYTPTIYNGDMSWFGSISGVVNQLPTPDWATASRYNWQPTEMVSNKAMNKPRPITFVSQPGTGKLQVSNGIFAFEKVPKTAMGPLGSGSGPLAKNPGRSGQVNNGGIFMNYNFPGGQAAKLTIYIPSIELPVTKLNQAPWGAWLFYEMTIQVTCTNGNVLATKRQFTIHNSGNGAVT